MASESASVEKGSGSKARAMIADAAGPREPALHRAWLRGLGAVAIRRVCLHLVGFGAGIILARILSPADLGIYFVANFYVTMLGTLQTTNMAGALIQCREDPSSLDETTLFTVEQALAVVAIFLVGLVGMAIYCLPPLANARTAYPFIVCLAFIWLINGFNLIPTVRLQRQVRFEQTALADGLSQLGFYVSAVVLALCNGGAWSYVVAALIQAGLKAGVLSWMSPWRVRFRISRDAARRYVFSGLCMQGTFVAYLARENMSPSLGALFYGTRGVGLYGWASSLAGAALLPSFIFTQVAFPTYARLQDNPDAISRLIGITFRVTAILAGPILLALLGFGSQLVQFVYGEKWRPALPVLYLVSATAPLALFVAPQLHALLATGRHKLALRIGAAWTGGLAVLALFLMGRLSYVGLAIAYAACYAVVAGVFFALADEAIRRTVLSTLFRFAIALGSALAVAVALRTTITNVLSLGSVGLLALAVYSVIALVLFWGSTREDIAWFRAGRSWETAVALP
jgi:O-antigen/teichoic acid export membrane protein